MEKQQTFPTESWKHRRAWAGSNLKDHLIKPAMGRDATLVRLPMPPSSLALNTSRHL